MSVARGDNEKLVIKGTGSDEPDLIWPSEPEFAFYLEQLSVHLSAQIDTLGDPASLYIQTPDGVGGWTSTLILQKDFAIDGSTNILWIPEQPVYFDIGERIRATSGNNEAVDYLFRIVVRR